MKYFSRTRQIIFIQWLFAPMICLLLGFYSITGEYFNKMSQSEKFSVSQIVANQLFYWCFWALLSPLILVAAKRFPFEHPSIWRSVLFHLPASFLCSILNTGFCIIVSNVWSSLKGVPFKSFNSYSALLAGIVPSVVIYFVLLGVHLVIYYQREYRNASLKAAELDAQLSGARLQALKMQLQPHFLFNTLHSITALVLDNESRNAVKMINRLSVFLRLTLDSRETQMVTLQDELEFVEGYLAIELIRFQNRLTVEKQIAPETLTAEVPNLILQPLVENAVRHGIAARTGACRIEIASRLSGSQLYLEVIDEGEGEKLNDKVDSASNGGVGLTNTQNRLQQLYGANAHFELISENNMKTTARIDIPFIQIKR